MRNVLRFACLLLLLATPATVADGLGVGQRAGPYTFVMATGPQRGKLHCYICDTADRPAVIVFARSLSDPLGKLVQRLDKALVDHEKAELRSWVTFLGDDQSTLDAGVVQWSKKHAIRMVPLGVFEDKDGPPSYRLSNTTDAHVLLAVQQKVVAAYSFAKGELTEEKIDDIMRTLPKIVGDKK